MLSFCLSFFVWLSDQTKKRRIKFDISHDDSILFCFSFLFFFALQQQKFSTKICWSEYETTVK